MLLPVPDKCLWGVGLRGKNGPSLPPPPPPPPPTSPQQKTEENFPGKAEAGNRFSCCSLDSSDYCETVLVRSRVFCFSSLHIARGDTTRSFPPSPSAASRHGSPSLHIVSAKVISWQPIAFHRTGYTAVYTAIQRVSHRGDQPSFLVADTLFVRCLVHR